MIDVVRRNKALTGIVVVVLLVLAAVTLARRDSAYPTEALHPGNPDPGGSRAVARVLAAQGVEVQTATTRAALEKQAVGPSTTLVVTSMSALGVKSAKAMLDRAAIAAAVVLVAPPPGLLATISETLEATGANLLGPLDADCDIALVDGLEVDVRSTESYRVTEPGADSCFTVDDASMLVRLDRRPTTYVVGGDVFTNASLDEADNAAVAMRLLGQHPRLVWYVPDAGDIAPGDGVSVSSLLPRWLWPSLLLLGAATLAMVLWRGRRLGPVTVEPLPVVVRNSEAVEARGRLYRRARDRWHVAGVLRDATRSRLAAHYGVTDLAQLVTETARDTGRPVADIQALLANGAALDERELVVLARDLSALEQDLALPMSNQHQREGLA